MAYVGDSRLDQKVQQRIMTAFAEAVRLYREGHTEESLTVLRSISDVDPQFKPAQRLEAAINANAPVDLAQLLGEMSAAADQDAAELVAKARQAFEQRDFAAAQSLAQAVLKDLPGHAEARKLVLEAQARQRAAAEVESLLARAKDALDAGQVEEAQGFLRLARNLDATHPGLAALEAGMPVSAGSEPEAEFEFEVFDHFGPATDVPAAAGTVPPPAPRPEPGGQFEAGGEFEPGFEEPIAPAAAPVVPPAVRVPPAPAPRGVPVAAVPAPAPAAPPAGFQVAPVVAPPAPVVAAPAPGGGVPAFGGGSPATAPSAGGFTFDSPMDEVGMEFGQVSMPAPAPPAGFEAAMGPDDRVQELLDQGQRAFDAGDFQAAIETWSRIYLLDAHNAEAELRIEQARRRREEVERLAEHRFYEAREAFEQGRLDDARALCREVLDLQPQHLEAHDLLQRLETPAAPPPPPVPSLAADEEDLFKDDFVPATIASTPLAGGAVAAPAPVRERPLAAREAEAPARRIFGLPLPMAAAAGAVLVAVAAGALFFGGKLLFRGSDKTATTISIADALAEKGQLADAIAVLESLSGQLEGERANLVNEKIQTLKRRLKARATPVPSFDASAIRAAIDGGQRMKALRMVQDALQKAPAEPQLLAFQSELSSYSNLLPQLANAVRDGNWEVARQAAGKLRQDRPADTEAAQVWRVATFNLALIALRKYQVAAASSLLNELGKEGDDPQAAKLQAFAKSYLSRPADPRYDLFVTSLEMRKVE
ncbi:MAG TPA: hypothetical protein P5234_13240 [Thermoanaerobaculaceae bacterium]|nr:hypothetical protein [Thermoanaerobaculaceae bacterium]HRS17197.1 hypothetical protein [Thermoanaerobaculaceae bacterium]